MAKQSKSEWMHERANAHNAAVRIGERKGIQACINALEAMYTRDEQKLAWWTARPIVEEFQRLLNERQGR